MGSGSQDRTSPALAGDPRQLWRVGSTAQPLPLPPSPGLGLAPRAQGVAGGDQE